MSSSAPPKSKECLADHLSGRDNNLNLIRAVAASAVLVSHAFPITLGEDAVQPLKKLTGMSLGAIAVAIFFVLSGLLIARSFDRGRSVIRFGTARVLRLFPALVVVLLLTVLAGALVTTLDPASYFTATKTLTYIPRNLSLAFLQYPLPGVIDSNPYPNVINGSLWTLFHEVICYLAVLALGLVGLLRYKVAFSCVFVLIVAGFFVAQGTSVDGAITARLVPLATLGFPFALGALAYVWRDHWVLDLRVLALLWVIALALSQTACFTAAFIVALAYSVIYLGFVPKGAVLNYNRLGDYSYGIYIYAFPLQQLAVYHFPEAGPLGNMALAAPATLLCAVISWHWIEKHALDQISPMAIAIEKALGRSPAQSQEKA